MALRSTVGEAARWMITEQDDRRLQKRPWVPPQSARSSEKEAPQDDDSVEEAA